MIVVDASVIANMLVYADERGRRARAALGLDTEWAAPEHWMIEVFSVVRGLDLAQKITASQAKRAVDQLPRLGVDHVRVEALLAFMWLVKDDINAYDAAYVALAASRQIPLVTGDGRLARTATRFCTVRLVV